MASICQFQDACLQACSPRAAKLQALHLILTARGQQQVSNISSIVISTGKGVFSNAGLDSLCSGDAVLNMIDVTTIACKALEAVLEICNDMFDSYLALKRVCS